MTGIIRFPPKILLEDYTIQRLTKDSLLSVKSHFGISKMIPFYLESCLTVKSMGKNAASGCARETYEIVRKKKLL